MALWKDAVRFLLTCHKVLCSEAKLHRIECVHIHPEMVVTKLRELGQKNKIIYVYIYIYIYNFAIN